MHYPSSPIDDIIANERPIKVDPSQVLVDDIGTTLAQSLRKFNREQKRAEHDANLRENYKPCRKNKCKLFLTRRCYLKTLEEQKSCWDNKEYLKPIPEPATAETPPEEAK